MGQETAVLRGIQAPAIRATQDGSSPVVAVMRTGGGKSMLFMLPAFVEPGGTTIVVVPLVALRQDMMSRCRALSIPCVAWESRRPPDEATIVLVTPESAVTDDFQTFINRLRQIRRLDRIVIDECHTVLNNQRDFRPELRQLGQLNYARTQIVLLTATLLPQLEPTLWQQIGYLPDFVHLFRDRTSRSNVAYRIWEPDVPRRTGSAWVTSEPVVTFIRERIQQAQGGRVIIYGSVVNQVVAVAGELACEAFYSAQIDKSSILQRFIEGPSRVIVATSALGMGVDIPDIRSIIHLGRPRSLLEYAQESGRAGRDGQTSEAIIIQPARWGHPGPDISTDIAADQELVDQYMEVEPGVGCRRYVLDGYMDETVDGYSRRYCQDSDVHEIACDGCDPDWMAQESMVSVSPSPGPLASQEASHPDWMVHESVVSVSSSPGPLASQEASQEASHQVSQEASHQVSQEVSHQISHFNTGSPSPSASEASGDSFVTQLQHPSPIPSASPPSGPSDPNQPPRAKRRRTDSIEPPPPTEPPTVDVVERQRQRVQAQRQAAPHVTRQAIDAQQWLDEEIIEREVPPWQRRCYICTLGGHDRYEHELYFCRNPEATRAQAWMQAVRSQRIRYAPYSACFRCGMPQTICRQWDQSVPRRGDCVYKDILVPMTAMMLFGPWYDQIQPLWQRRLRQHEIDSEDIGQVVRFFGQATDGARGQHSQLFHTFCWLWQICKELEGIHCTPGIRQFIS
ncbi:DEAD/DEAH box helicase [Aspergillus affinis]|uniref:DEAD/DEAH box helicase n=1 Tax=Aspergillus affinis TaxID=1070780 RepID=UPI0022FF0F30|nr:DEAD/DEAH box helicase [Aspergillus affinis]KAI9034797.1 DEAD/DEAH box helicase [Aspergillus affinis]